MGVFEALHEGPASAAELAARLSANADALGRLLDGLLALGLVRKQAEVYQNDPVAETYLYDGSSHSQRGYVRYSDEALYPMWGHLDDAVGEGTPLWTQTFGLHGPIFSALQSVDGCRTSAALDAILAVRGAIAG